MSNLKISISFRGMTPPTAKLTGHDACAITFNPLINGHEEKSDRVIFAYEDGIVWTTMLIGASKGDYRATLISNALHCYQDISIGDDTLAEGVVRLRFTHEHCQRKSIPPFLMRLWWAVRNVCDKIKEHPLCDQIALSKYRRRFRRGPIGAWVASHDMLTVYGCSIEFRKDATGTARTWGYDEESSVADSTCEFRWRSVGDFAIEVYTCGENKNDESWESEFCGIIEFDYLVTRSVYGHRIVLMYSKSGPGYNVGETNFWLSTHPVELNI